MRGVVSEMSSV